MNRSLKNSLLLLVLLCMGQAAHAGSELRQFTAGGHVLGFAPDYAVLAGGSHALKVEFLDANAVEPQSASGEAQTQDGKAPPLGEVRYPGLWQGIDLMYRAAPGGIAESVYRLEPGAEVSRIRLGYSRPIQVNADGSLSIRFETGVLTESAPIAWQEREGQKLPVTVAFTMRGERKLGFTLGEHDPALAVWIDPTLSWNTFLEGYGSALFVDSSDNVYVAGGGNHTSNTSHEAFVAKLDSGGALVWHASLGGHGSARTLAVDDSGNVYVAGYTSANRDWYTPWNAPPVRALSDDNDPYTVRYDAFVAKLTNGGTPVWHTFLGGSSDDSGAALALDSSGNVYVAGTSEGTWQGITTPVRAFIGGGDAYYRRGDAFAAKLTSSGALVWNTFLGGSEYDGGGGGLAVDSSGNVYVAGTSDATWGSPARAFTVNGTDGDAFAAKLNNSGELVWNTFLGGSEYDDGSGLAVDSSGNVYVAGTSDATWGSPARAYSGDGDAFAARLDSSNGTLVWNTFLGGSENDYGEALALDSSGAVYVAGSGETWGSPARAYSGGYSDAFAARLDSNGALVWNTFLGGSGFDQGRALTLDGSGNVYVAGTGYAWGSPVQAAYSGSGAFVAKLLGDSATQADYQRVMNWAESVLPALLVPQGKQELTIAPYQVRYYPATGTYLGYNPQDGRFYGYNPALWGPDVAPFGLLSEYLPAAGAAGF